MGVTLRSRGHAAEYDIPYSRFASLRTDIDAFLKQPLISPRKGTLLFLTQSDCDGKLSYTECKQLLADIKSMPDDGKLYGYIGRGESQCLTITKFKELLQNCVNRRCILRWF